MRFVSAFSIAAVVAAAVAVYSLTPGAASTANKYDVNSDGSVTIADALLCISQEGAMGAGLACDVNADAAVSVADVLAIVGRIGPEATATTGASTATRPATATPTRTLTAVPSSTPTRTSTPAVTTTPVGGSCSIGATSIALDTEERAFLTLINNYRASNALQPLAISYALTQSSAWKSHDMGTSAYFAHDDLGRTWVQRVVACGYTASGYIGENIAAGYTTAQAVFDAWRASPGHNANMLNAGYHAIGIGREYVAGSPYGWYWTTDFGAVADGTGGLQ